MELTAWEVTEISLLHSNMYRVLSSLFFQFCLLCRWYLVFILFLVLVPVPNLVINVLVISAHFPFTDFLILIPGTLFLPLLFVSTNRRACVALSRQRRIFPLYIPFLFLATLLS
jgi:hypothetical protein